MTGPRWYDAHIARYAHTADILAERSSLDTCSPHHGGAIIIIPLCESVITACRQTIGREKSRGARGAL